MAERLDNGYKRLFEVRLLHHYWLDEGNKVFDSLDEDIRIKRLLHYDVRQFLSIEPTKTTEQLLKGLQCVFKQTALGFVVAVPEGIEITDSPSFDFVLTVQDADFLNYTALTFRPQKIHELNSPSDNTIFRCKENVFVFTNSGGSSKILFNPPQPEPPDPNDPNPPPPPPPNKREVKFLSRSISGYDSTITYQAESLIEASDLKLWQAVKDQPGSIQTSGHWQKFADIDHQPIYVHQDDIPFLSFPSGMGGPHFRGIELTPDIPDSIFALIRIKKLAPSAPLGLVDATGFVCPVFEIRFKNRSTKWRYFNKNNSTVSASDLGPFPLTCFGNASSPVKQKPSAGNVKAEIIGTQIINLISEIHI